MFKLRSFSIEKLFELLKNSCIKESIYCTERKSYLNNSENEFVKSSERDEMVAFLLEVCDREDMSLSVETFSLFVTLLDRFLSTYKVKSKYLEVLSVACLYIASKVKEEDDKISITSEFLLDCDCKCSIGELLRMEQMVLSKFEWSVNDITAADFLHIFYALLVNQYKQAETSLEYLIKNSDLNKQRPWKSLVNSINSRIKSDGNLYPPGNLDFLDSLEEKLKQCLCVNDLTNMYKPHILAYSLLSIQMEKAFEKIGSDIIKSSLNEMLDTIKQQCKLNIEVVDKCKEKLKIHLASVENTKTLFDNYFDQYYHWKISNLRKSSIFISPLSAVNTQLDVIKEEEELEEENSYYENENIDLDEESCDISDYAIKKFSLQKDTSNFPPLNFSNSSFFNNNESQFKSPFFQEYKFLNTSYADILVGRTDNKRKLSENSNEEEKIECD